MTSFRSAMRAVVAAVALLAGGKAMADLATIEGTATYRERIAMPPGAVLEVELLDISRADAPSDRLASIRIRPKGQVPVPFTLHYDTEMIEASHSYVVAATLLDGDSVLFRSTTVHPVLTQGAGESVDVLMVKTDAAAAGAALAGPTWVAEDIGGRGVIDDLQSHITFGADGTVSGSGGCNGFGGNYTLADGKLALGPLAGTMMACPDAIMDQETRFHAALAQAKSYRIEQGLLFLLGEDGGAVMRMWPRD